MDLSTSIGPVKLKNPLMPASGPLVSTLEKMLYLQESGVGCMVAKTISVKGAEVPRPCICTHGNSIMNCELWSEYPLEYWLSNILPELKERLDIPLILSVGYTKENMEVLIPSLNEYADGFEVSTHYVGKDLNVIGETVKTIVKYTDKPVFMKLSPHIPDPAAFAKIVRDNGASGVVAINSLGPTMKIDLKNRRVSMGNENGEVWTSGPVIKPLALAIINRIKTAMPDFTVIGAGGIGSAEDVLEFLLAGADAVQMLSGALLKGKDLYKNIIDSLPNTLVKYGFSSIKEVIDTPLKKEVVNYVPEHPVIDKRKCRMCGMCEAVCPYFAITIGDSVYIDNDKCFGCGLCMSRCPVGAIGGVY